MRRFVLVTALLLITPSFANAMSDLTGAVPIAPRVSARVAALKITALSTMLADHGIGEWGYAAIVEADGRKFLFDTGARPETVLRNAAELRIDLSEITDVILSHNHGDHTGGLLTLRRELMRRNPRALSRVHVAEGIFWSRPTSDGREGNRAVALKEAYESTGGEFVQHSRPVQLAPGVWFSGPIPRLHPERNWSETEKVLTPNGLVEDNVPEDASLIVDTADGLVVLSGCGHAGVVNTAAFSLASVRSAPILALVGGFHLFQATNEALTWTGEQLKAMGVRYLLAGHCTGIEATMQLRALLELDRQSAVISAVGSSFTLGVGIDPVRLAK